MEKQTRHRIAGTIFLLSTGFIFITLMLDDSQEEIVDIPDLVVDQESITRIPSYDEVAPETNVVSVIEDLKSEVDEDGYSTEHGTRFGQPVLIPFSSSTKVFAVQAGSFEVSKNADSLISELREEGYEAFVSSKKSSGGVVMHRVAVGPMLDKKDADEMRESISEQFKLDARIMELTL